jgi:hypothetical protein
MVDGGSGGVAVGWDSHGVGAGEKGGVGDHGDGCVEGDVGYGLDVNGIGMNVLDERGWWVAVGDIGGGGVGHVVGGVERKGLVDVCEVLVWHWS